MDSYSGMEYRGKTEITSPFIETCKLIDNKIQSVSKELPYLIEFTESVGGVNGARRIRICCYPDLIVTRNDRLENLIIDVEINPHACEIDIYYSQELGWERHSNTICDEKTLFKVAMRCFKQSLASMEKSVIEEELATKRIIYASTEAKYTESRGRRITKKFGI